MDRSRMAVAVMLLVASCAYAQKPMPKDAEPRFEVTTVKATPPEQRNQSFGTQGSHIRLVRQTVLSMIMFAYGIHSKQVADAPEWVSTNCFDVDGIPDVAGEPSLPQFQRLVKQLLVERFGLQVHPSQRDLSYYALRVASSGVKIAKSTSPEDTGPDQTGNGGPKGQTMRFTNNSMAEFALGMQYFADRPVVNETGLSGRYDFTLQWMPDTMKVPENDSAPTLFTAIREQLGLELKAAKGPADVMVVTAVTKPGEN